MDNTDLFLHLYDTHGKELSTFALRQFDDFLAEDLVEETFVEAWRKIGDLQTHPNPRLWLFKTLSNKCKQERDRKSHQMEFPLEHVEFPVTDTPAGIEELLPKNLPPRDRQILILRFQYRLEFCEIAEELGIREPAARKRVSRALEQCRRQMRDKAPPEPPPL